MTAENQNARFVAEDEIHPTDIVETLTSAGFTVVGEAADGEEAVQLASNSNRICASWT